MFSSIKFPFDSDFIDSFLNYVILKRYHPNERSLIKDAEIYNSCVNMGRSINIIANCSDRRDRVNDFIEKNPSIASYKEIATSKCADELSETHMLNHSTIRQSDDVPSYNSVLTSMKYNEKLANLEKCIEDASKI
jgi:hypothetical protein